MAKITVKYRSDGTAEHFADGKPITQEEFDRRIPSQPIAAPGGTQPTGWPMESQALAVHPDQVAQANDRAKRHGINVVYKKNGTCVIPDAGNRKKLLKLEGYHDRSSFI